MVPYAVKILQAEIPNLLRLAKRILGKADTSPSLHAQYPHFACCTANGKPTAW